jgi:hypothetical protein
MAVAGDEDHRDSGAGEDTAEGAAHRSGAHDDIARRVRHRHVGDRDGHSVLKNQTRFDHVALVGTQANAAVQRARSPITMIATNMNDHHCARPDIYLLPDPGPAVNFRLHVFAAN